MFFYIRSWNGDYFKKEDVQRLLGIIKREKVNFEDVKDPVFTLIVKTQHGYAAYDNRSESIMLWRPQDVLSRGILREHPVVSNLPKARKRNVRKACFLLTA